MEWMTFWGRTASLMAMLYAATVIELSWPAGEFTPSVIVLAVTLMVCTSRPTAAVFGATVAGFVIDAASPGRLGPFVMAYGLIASAFVSLGPAAQRSWWFAPCLSFALASCHPLVLALLARADSTSFPQTNALLTAAILRGTTTACATALGLMLMAMVQRLWCPARSSEPLALTNRWNMITE